MSTMPALDGTDGTAPHGTLLSRLSAAVGAASRGSMRALTTIHPCFVDGVRTLVHKRGLEADQPGVFERLKRYAAKNGFALLEDRRKRELTCRDERRRVAPVLVFAASLLGGNLALAENGMLTDGEQLVVPTIEIVGTRTEASEDREYLNIDGKRFISEPHGEIQQILKVAAEVRSKGEYHRVRTRGLQMPSEYTGSFIDRYDYTIPTADGERAFSYYEGDGFAALGYHSGKGKVILDVIAGGGPFTGPRLWGAYDQVLNSNIRMDLMFGDGKDDSMGLLKASYKIGLMPVMRTSSKNYYGELYSRAVAQAADAELPALPQIRQADTVDPDEAGDAG